MSIFGPDVRDHDLYGKRENATDILGNHYHKKHFLETPPAEKIVETPILHTQYVSDEQSPIEIWGSLVGAVVVFVLVLAVLFFIFDKWGLFILSLGFSLLTVFIMVKLADYNRNTQAALIPFLVSLVVIEVGSFLPENSIVWSMLESFTMTYSYFMLFQTLAFAAAGSIAAVIWSFVMHIAAYYELFGSTSIPDIIVFGAVCIVFLLLSLAHPHRVFFGQFRAILASAIYLGCLGVVLSWKNGTVSMASLTSLLSQFVNEYLPYILYGLSGLSLAYATNYTSRRVKLNWIPRGGIVFTILLFVAPFVVSVIPMFLDVDIYYPALICYGILFVLSVLKPALLKDEPWRR